MRLVKKELDKLIVSQVGLLAQRRLCRGVKLNRIEAIGLISHVILELARDGNHSIAELMSIGKEILGTRHVMLGVALDIETIQLEATLPDGTFLITIHGPIASQDGDIRLAIYGSFLPKFDNDALFPILETDMDISYYYAEKHELIPTEKKLKLDNERVQFGFYSLVNEKIKLCEGRERIKLNVSNMGDRPIQVGSHYHFIETNKLLMFDRIKAYGFRLDIPAGTSIRFEPGDRRRVQLVKIGGNKVIHGGNGFANGKVQQESIRLIQDKLLKRGIKFEVEEIDSNEYIQPALMDRRSYCSMFGPTVGDKVQLGKLNLVIEVEKDFTCHGDELKFGGGKTFRDGMGQAVGYDGSQVVDLVITNALILDAYGIFKADIGIKNGVIVGLGKAGNPDMMDNVTIVCGAGTECIAGEGKIITASGIDTHIHYICPQLCEEAIGSGVTTFIGGGTGPSAGTNATTCTPGPNNLNYMFKATDNISMNFGFTGKGNSSSVVGLEDQIEAGAIGIKVHEDWGSTPMAIDTALKVCDKYDVQCTLHTDTLNESGFVEDTVAAFKNRTIHTYHSEGAGGGHAPDIIKVCQYQNVIPSSTNPTRPYTTNTLDEHVDMLMVCHHLSPSIPEDVAFAESRIRAETIAAEDVLHDLGAISIISSDSQAMGRVGEVISRTWKTAHKMKAQRGHLKPDLDNKDEGLELADNFRVRRYLAKYTINPAKAHGISHILGSIQLGKLADLVIYRIQDFGGKPDLVLKSGTIIYSQMGEANASIPTCEPIIGRYMFEAPSITSILFISNHAHQTHQLKKLDLKKKLVPVKGCREVTKKDMVLNDYMPIMKVDPETYKVEADDKDMSCQPAGINVGLPLPLNQDHYLF